MLQRPTRNCRPPSRADEVISFTPPPRTTVESSAPPELVTAATVTTPGLIVSQGNRLMEDMWSTEALPNNAGEPIAVEVPTIPDSGNNIDPDDLDEPVPQLESPDDSDSSEDEREDATNPGADDRAAHNNPVASPTPVVPLATRAGVPPAGEALEIFITDEPAEKIRSRLLAYRNRAIQPQAVATAPREFLRMDTDTTLYDHLQNVLVRAGRSIPIPNQQSPLTPPEASSPFIRTPAAIPVPTSRPRTAANAPVGAGCPTPIPSQQSPLTPPEASSPLIMTPAALPISTTRPRTVANTTSASTSSDTAVPPSPVQIMLARRFTAEREYFVLIGNRRYGTAYLAVLRVKRVLAVCEALGIRPNKSQDTIRMEHMQVSYGDVLKCFGVEKSHKNAHTLYNKVLKAYVALKAQDRGARLQDETLLIRLLEFMLTDAPINDSEGNRDPCAAQASQMCRGELETKLLRFWARAA